MYLYQINFAKSVVSIFFLVLNLISVLFAIIVIAVSSAAISSLSVVRDLDGTLQYLTSSIILLAFCGVLWLIASCVGFFASVTTFYTLKDSCKQTAYGSHLSFSFLMVILCIFEFIGALVIFGIRNDLMENFEGVYLDTLQSGLSNSVDPDFENALDRLQNYFECCGFNGPEDYTTTKFGAYGRLVKSCCGLPKDSLLECYQLGAGLINYGCRSKIEELLNKHYTDVGTLGLCFGFVELLSLSLSLSIVYFIYKEDSGCFYTKY